MKLFQDCWVALLQLYDTLTLLSTADRSLSQTTVLQSKFKVPILEYDYKGPRFSPPSGPEDPNSKFTCDYSAMGIEWKSCSSEKDRGCWLEGPKGQKYNISTDYETKYPNGTTRKVSPIF